MVDLAVAYYGHWHISNQDILWVISMGSGLDRVPESKSPLLSRAVHTSSGAKK